MRAFQWYLGGGLGPILEPKPSNLPSWPSCGCQLQFLPPTKNKLISSSADPAQRWNDTINWSMVSAGCGPLLVLCPDDMIPCPGDFVDAKKIASGGYLHLLQASFGAAAAIEHRPDVPFWSGVAASAAQAQYWSLHSRPQQGGRWESVWCVNDASCTK